MDDSEMQQDWTDKLLPRIAHTCKVKQHGAKCSFAICFWRFVALARIFAGIVLECICHKTEASVTLGRIKGSHCVVTVVALQEDSQG